MLIKYSQLVFSLSPSLYSKKQFVSLTLYKSYSSHRLFEHEAGSFPPLIF